jgi:THO complex subunit 2
VYRKYPMMELDGLLQYLVNGLKKNQSLDLLVLKEVLARMGGVDTVEQMSLGQIESRASGDTLRAETRHGVAPLKRSLGTYFSLYSSRCSV